MTIRLSQEWAFKMLVFMSLGFSTIRLFFDAFFSYFNISFIGYTTFYGLFAIFLVFSMPYLKKSISLSKIIFFIAWIVYCLYSANCTDIDSKNYVALVKYIALFGGIYLIVGSSIRVYSHIIKECLYKMPFPLIILGILNYIIISDSLTSSDYSMELSYANMTTALICTVIFYAGEINNKTSIKCSTSIVRTRFFSFINLILSYALVLIGGSRGPILAILIIAILSTIYSFKYSKNTSVIIISFIVVLIILGNLLLFSNYFSESHIRLFSLMAKNNIMETSGREYYARISLKGILDHAFMGVGVFKDRIYIYNRFHRAYATNSLGSYPHNFFLEVLLQYGIIIGGVLIITFLVLLFKAYKEQIQQSQEVLLLMIGLFIPLLVSKSYVQTWDFYMILGFVLEINNEKSRQVVKKISNKQITEKYE